MPNSKKITFKKGIDKIHFPVFGEIEGESIKAIRKIQKLGLPKHSRISFVRDICYKKGLEYDMTEVIIEK